MGARGHGHIDVLCSMARPTVGVELAVAPVHVEHMGGLDQIMVAKRELVEALPRDGVAVLNADDARVLAMASHTPASVLTFGLGGEGPSPDVTATDVTIDDELHPTCTIRSPWGTRDDPPGGAGPAQRVERAGGVRGGALVGCADRGGGGGPGRARRSSAWRMDLVRSPSGTIVLNDAYNASPTSMAAALRALASLPGSRRIAVLGYMAELGETESQDHRAVAALAEELGIELLAVGTDLYGRRSVPDADGGAGGAGRPRGRRGGAGEGQPGGRPGARGPRPGRGLMLRPRRRPGGPARAG